MRKIVDGVLYDADHASLIYGCRTLDDGFSRYRELRRTKQGQFLLMHVVGASQAFKLITESDAKCFLEQYAPIDAYTRHFPLEDG